MKQRQLKVIQLLLENKEYLSAKTYANLLGISEKSFRRDLEELEPFFKKYDAEVIKKIGVGVLLEVDPQQRILLNAEIEKLVWIDKEKEFHSLNGTNRKKDMRLNLLLSAGEIYSVSQIAASYYLSKSSAYHDLQMVENFFREHDLTIEKGTKGSCIQGNEFTIRKLIINELIRYEQFYDFFTLQFNFELISAGLIQKLKSLFVEEDIRELTKLIEEKNRQFIHPLTNEEKNWMFTALLIQIYRIRMNHMINASNQSRKALLEYESDLSNACIHVVKKQTNRKLTIEEITYIHWVLSTLSLNDHPQSERQNIENVAEEFTNDFVDAFSAITGLSLRNKQSFYQNISQHIFFMISRVVNGQRFKNPILDKMRNEYRAMEKVCSIICWILAKKHGTSCINDDEISYLMLYIQGEIIDLEPKMNTLVIFDLQKSLQSLFQIQLSKRFPNLNVTFTDNDGGKNLPEYDLIINTKSMKNKLQEANRIAISPILTESDFDLIDETITKIISNRNDNYLELSRILNDLKDIGVEIMINSTAVSVEKQKKDHLVVIGTYGWEYHYSFSDQYSNKCLIFTEDIQAQKNVIYFYMSNWDFLLFSTKLVYLIENSTKQIVNYFRQYLIEEWS